MCGRGVAEMRPTGGRLRCAAEGWLRCGRGVALAEMRSLLLALRCGRGGGTLTLVTHATAL